jgi:undecaprenyl-diphosphatase
MSWVLQENYHLFVEINRYAGQSRFLDAIMVVCANGLVFVWPLILLLLWGCPQLLRKRPLRPGEAEIIATCRAACVWSIGACLLAIAFNVGLEHLIFEPRPFVTHPVHLLISHAADDSFPSDHAAVSFAVAGMLLFTLPLLLVAAWNQRVVLWQAQGWHRLLWPFLLMGLSLLLACSIGIARVFVGVHYPGDILGGALSGWSAAGIMAALRRPLRVPTEALLRAASRLHLA